MDEARVDAGFSPLHEGDASVASAVPCAWCSTSRSIQGAGQIGVGTALTLNNQGTINANLSNSLTLASSTTATNTGTLEATAGGTLNVQNSVTNTNGTILSTGTNSVVNLNAGTVTGGTLTTTSGGTLFAS
jgi:hypothetical protein